MARYGSINIENLKKQAEEYLLADCASTIAAYEAAHPEVVQNGKSE